jgi:raffinose/stachyose/melibiose transport system substrate-binding protein/xylobiose transport system substrate-binding protein
MRSKWRRLTAAAAACITGVSLAACSSTEGASGAGGGSGSSGKVVVWAVQDDTLNPVVKAEMSKFNNANHASASLQTFVNDPYKQKLQTALGSPQAPDVFFNWGGGNLAQYVHAGDVVDLTSLLNGDPTWKAKFLPSVLNTAKIDGKYYGEPMEGVQPVFLFVNKAVMTKANITAMPATWDDLLTDVDKMKAAGISNPIALAGTQSWTELMWLEYLLDRVGGPQKFADIVAGKPGAWSDPAVVQALTMIQDLVKRGAFGSNFSAINYDNHGTEALFTTGKSGMQLMGSWELSGLVGTFPKFMKTGNLEWAPFPAVSNGAGDPKDIVGNPSNFYSITKSSKNVKTAEAFLKTVSSDDYVAQLIKIGQVPAIAGVESQLNTGNYPDYTQFVYGLVKNAPSFAQSWDQALSPSVAQTMLTNLQKVFLNKMSPRDFGKAMDAAK